MSTGTAMNAALQAQLAQLAQIHQLVMKNSSSLSQMQQQLQERVTSSCLSHHEPPAKRAHLLADDGASDDILDAVFSFVGVEEYLFAAGVSRKWRVRYLKLCYSEAASAIATTPGSSDSSTSICNGNSGKGSQLQ